MANTALNPTIINNKQNFGRNLPIHTPKIGYKNLSGELLLTLA